MSRPLLLADTPFLLYRAFYGLPKSIKGADGKPVNALLGTANALLAAAAEHDARAVVACFGPDAAPYRVELYEGYHAHRPPMPPQLSHQWERAPALLEALGYTIANDDSVEADDLLGSYATAEVKAGGEALIFTGDRDLFQCAGDGVQVLLAARGGPVLVDAAEVERRYGIPPALVPDFIALRGDPSDGIPGAKGIGEKTAADMLRRNGSLEAVLDNAAADSRLASERESLLAYKEIATLRSLKVKRPRDKGLDRKAGAAAARQLGMERLAKRLEEGG
jgi:DNA polymerase-1